MLVRVRKKSVLLMTFEVQQIDKTLKILGTLDISGADAFRETLARQLEYCSGVDLSEVESCDATALQLLYSARKSAEGRGQTFQITGISEAVKAASNDLGVNMEELV